MYAGQRGSNGMKSAYIRYIARVNRKNARLPQLAGLKCLPGLLYEGPSQGGRLTIGVEGVMVFQRIEWRNHVVGTETWGPQRSVLDVTSTQTDFHLQPQMGDVND